MGLNNSNKTVSTSQIDCTGTLKVTLALSASPDISSSPTDIVLILDRSGSMAGSPLANMKSGAKKFIDIIDEATDSSQDGNIGSGSRIGIVSFADTAVQNTQLITSVADLKAAVDSLTAGGSTNHADAFEKAAALFDPASSNAKVMVMFTDGKTTSGPDPSPVAAAARASGIIIYCIGLIGSDGIDPEVLNDWATGIVIDEVLNPDFVISGILMPTKGTASMISDTALKWTIDSLGTTANEGASLEFFAKHTAGTSGIKQINQSITYTDNENNQAVFPNPSVQVECEVVVIPEPCPVPVDFSIGSCQDSIVYNVGDISLESQGRILQLNFNLKNVCPGKRTVLGIILNELDPQGNEYQRGMKTVTVPAHSGPSCRDVLVKCVKFVLPEALSDVLGRLPDRVVVKAKIIGTVTGLSEFKHDPVAVVGMAADHGHAVVVLHVQMQVFFIDFRDFFHGNDPFAVYDGHMQGILYIVINGSFGNVRRQAGHRAFQKIVVVDDQRQIVQKMDALDIDKLRARREAGPV